MEVLVLGAGEKKRKRKKRKYFFYEKICSISVYRE